MFEWLRSDVGSAHDVAVADWILETLEPWSHDGVRLASFMPDGFESHARVLHPFLDARATPPAWRSWQEVGTEHGIPLRSDVTAAEVSAIGRPYLGRLPEDGKLPERVCGHLVAMLARNTATPKICWFCVWSGWGILGSSSHEVLVAGRRSRKELRRQRAAADDEAGIMRSIPKVAGPGRDYLLFNGPIEAACSFEPIKGRFVSPSLWWPEDRAWIVVTEIDGHSSYVGGSRRTIDEIVRSPDLEAIEVTRDVPID
jgi:hypothetical protein